MWIHPLKRRNHAKIQESAGTLNWHVDKLQIPKGSTILIQIKEAPFFKKKFFKVYTPGYEARGSTIPCGKRTNRYSILTSALKDNDTTAMVCRAKRPLRTCSRGMTEIYLHSVQPKV